MSDETGNDTVPQTYAAKLTVYGKSGEQESSIELQPGSYIMGRSEDCDIRFEGASNVSRHHAELTVEQGKAQIRDLNSTVGMMVNSQIVTTCILADQDIVQLGMMKFRIELPQSASQIAEKKSIKVALTANRKVEDFGEGIGFLREKCNEMRREIGKVIVGQTGIVDGILAALLCQGHCLLVGVPGLAKTMLVRTFSTVSGLQTKRIQFTPDLMPTDILGSEMLKKSSADAMPELQFVQGPVFTQLLLADEINRTPPKTQAALLEAMQEHQVTAAMKSYQLPMPFCVIATQNPIEQEGTYPLPEAQRDRFMFCLHLDYPAYDEELEVMRRTAVGESYEPQRIVNENDIIRFQQITRSIGIPSEQMELAVKIIRATRPGTAEAKKAGVSDLIEWGAGPRAGQSVLRGAKASAAMAGRPAVVRSDIGHLLLPVLRHRIACSYRARAEGMNEDTVIRKIVKSLGMEDELD